MQCVDAFAAGAISKLELIDFCSANAVANVAKLLTTLGVSGSYTVTREAFMAKHAAGDLASLFKRTFDSEAFTCLACLYPVKGAW